MLQLQWKKCKDGWFSSWSLLFSSQRGEGTPNKTFFLQRWPKLISIFGWNGSFPDFKIALHLLSSLEKLKRGLFFKMENLETFRLKKMKKCSKKFHKSGCLAKKISLLRENEHLLRLTSFFVLPPKLARVHGWLVGASQVKRKESNIFCHVDCLWLEYPRANRIKTF